MRVYFSGPRIWGIRPGVSFDARKLPARALGKLAAILFGAIIGIVAAVAIQILFIG